MQFSKCFWMVLVVALVAATPLQAGIVLQDDFNAVGLDGSKWTTMLGGSSSITQPGDGYAHFLKGGGSAERPFLASVGQWIPADGAITVTGKVRLNGTSYFDVWTRAANYLGSWNGVADSGVRLGMSPSSRNIEGQDKQPGEIWVGIGTTVQVPTGGADKTWDFVVTDDGTNVTFTVTEEGVPTNTNTFYGTSTLAVEDEFHVLFTGHDISLDEVTIAQIPEPATWLLLTMLGVCGFGLRAVARRR